MKLLFSLLFFCSISGAQERLVLVGGGTRPAAALQQFADWAAQKNILVVSWASEIPKEVGDSFAEGLRPYFAGEIQFSYEAPADAASREVFKNQLANATGVFFTGGDQSRIMAEFEGAGGAELESLVRAAYHKGVVMGGTSAGTAIMSAVMITGGDGDGVQTARGLNFIAGDKFILDMHFSQRNREHRLLKAMQNTHVSDGMGVDEATAILVENRTSLKVVGDYSVHAFSVDHGFVKETVLHAGDMFELKLRAE